MSAPTSARPEGASTASALTVAAYTGGTFTDLVAMDRRGGVVSLKVPSTPDDPARAVLAGIRELLGPDLRWSLLHGSTVATNALLERAGARVVLVTNEGFEDVIEIGRQNRPQLYALVGERPPPLVDRDDRLGVPGRLGPRGEEVEPLDEEALAALAERVRERGPGAVAVCLLHAYASPAHEEAVAAALEGVGAPVSVSSRLLPEFREYERTSTTVVNAYVAPLMSGYLGRLAAEPAAERVAIMGSGGGTLSVARARVEPVHTVLSGPAGGVVGALTWARRAGFERIVTFDMGGTSTDVSLCPGAPLHTREFTIAGQPVAIPVVDIHTVGAGGGSLARVDTGGALRVGPGSAGADPGPICYGRGGTGVTVTDAHLHLGRLPADGFLGGERTLDRDAVVGPLADLAQRLGVHPDEAAEGIVEVADAAMERALRVISVERGYDPVEFVVVAFGGAGGLHVAELTRRLGAPRALVPPDPGLLSAYGMLASPPTREASRTVLLDEGEAQDRMAAVFDTLEAEARSELAAEGAEERTLSAERSVDARYRGQSFELRVPAEGWAEAFHRLHEERYGYRRDGTAVEAVTLRVVVRAPTPELPVGQLDPAAGDPPTTPCTVVYHGRRTEAVRVRREALGAGALLHGPAVLEEYSGTTWVPPDWSVEVDRWGCLHLLPAG